MAFGNLSFEDAGLVDGLPDLWSLNIPSQAERFAIWGSGVGYPWEDFTQEWTGPDTALFAFAFPPDVSELSAAAFDTSGETVEDFEEEWSSNESFAFEWSASVAASFDTTVPETVEDFEEEWSSNESFDFTMGSVTAASFDAAGTPENVEDFEELWKSNESFDFTMGSVTAASFDPTGTPENYEDFEETKAPLYVAVDDTADTFTATSHGFTNGEIVTFTNYGGRIPSPLVEGYNYYVVGATTNTFQVASTVGGAAINLSDAGVGSQFVVADPYTYWTQFMETL